MSTRSSDFRERIYGDYLGSAPPRACPAADDLASRAPYLRALVRRHFPEDRSAKILDLGCGSGGLIRLAREAGYVNISGVDRSSQQVAEAARLGIPGVSEGDLMETLQELPDGSLDVAVAFDVVEHFDRGELLAFVDEVHRVLRPGGRWIIHTINAEAPFFGRIRYGDFTHELAFTRRSMQQLLRASGFARVDCFEDTPVPHGLKSSVRLAVWRGVRLALRVYLAAETGDTGRDAIFSQNFLTVARK